MHLVSPGFGSGSPLSCCSNFPIVYTCLATLRPSPTATSTSTTICQEPAARSPLASAARPARSLHAASDSGLSVITYLLIITYTDLRVAAPSRRSSRPAWTSSRRPTASQRQRCSGGSVAARRVTTASSFCFRKTRVGPPPISTSHIRRVIDYTACALTPLQPFPTCVLCAFLFSSTHSLDTAYLYTPFTERP